MPVGFSSAARNLFLLGSTGSVASNFFKQVDESSNTLGTWIPQSIIFNTADEKYIVGGYNKDSNTKDRGWISKRDYDAETDPENPTTTQEWNVESQYALPNGGSVRFNSVKLDVNNKVIIAGDYNDGTGNLPLVARYSATGVLEWQATSYYNGKAYDITSDDNNYYICGTNNDGEAFVEKYDTDGNPMWGQLVSTGNANVDTTLESIGVNDRGHVVAGGTLDATNPERGYLIKINTDTGEVLWDKTFFRAYDENGTFGYNAPVSIWKLYVDSKDQIYVTGTYGSPKRQWIAKLTAEGNIIWQKGTTNTTNVMDGLSITPMGIRSDGETEQTIVLSKQADTIQTYLLLSKYSKDGELVWRRKLDKGIASSASPLRTYGISLDADPSFYYVSYVDQSFNAVSGTPDTYYFGKVSSSGNGIGAFDYDDGSAVTLEYTIYSGDVDVTERIKDGSVRNDTSDMMSYPFGADQLVFDDLATPVANKKRRVTNIDTVNLNLDSAISPRGFPLTNLLPYEYSGTGDWLDSSENGVNGQLFNPSFDNTAPDHFEIGTGKRVQLPNYTTSNKTAFSVETWVKFDSLTAQATSSGYIWDQSTENSGCSLRVKETAGKELLITLNPSLTLTYQVTGSSVTTGTWYHIITTFDAPSNEVSLYIDGDKLGTSPLTWSQVQSLQQDLPFTIGSSARSLGVGAGEAEFLTPGQYEFDIPTGLTSISAVLVGGGGGGSASTSSNNGVSGGGGGGGALSWVNGLDISGETKLYITVGAGGNGGSIAGQNDATDGGDSWIRTGNHVGTIIARAGGGDKGAYSGPTIINNGGVDYSGTYTGTSSGGGTGGRGGRGQSGHQSGGGGGAGGYEGDGGQGSDGTQNNRQSGNGGGGGGGGSVNTTENHKVQVGGGGVGLWGMGAAGGQGSSPVSGTTTSALADAQGFAGSGGSNKDPWTAIRSKEYGGGGTGNEDDGDNGAADGGGGGVRLLWGASRLFPDINVGLDEDGGPPDGPDDDSNASVGGSSLTASDWSHYGGKYRDCQDGGFKLYSSGNSSVADFFMGCWVKFDTYETNRRIGIELYMGNEMIYWNTEANGAISVRHHAGTSSTSSATDLDDGGWHHIGLSVDSGTLTGYVDGVAEVSTTSGVSGNSVIGDTNFGFFASGINDDFNADVKVLDPIICLGVGKSNGYSLNKPIIDANFAASNGGNARAPFSDANNWVYQSSGIALNGNTSDYNYKTGTGITWSYQEIGTVVEGGTGGAGGGNREYMDGDLGEFRIYNNVLSPLQAYQNYNASKSRYIDEKISTAPKVVSDSILINNNLILNYDFGNRACIDGAHNKIPWSFDEGNWGEGSNGTLVRNAGIAPDGTNTATKASTVSSDIDTSPQLGPVTAGATGQIAITGGKEYTLSIWAKASTPDQVGNDFKLRWKRVQGTGVFPEITFQLEKNWKRYSVSGRTFSDNSTIVCYVGGVIGSEALVWGAQLEEESSSTVFTPTYGTAKVKPTTVNNLSSSSFTGTFDAESAGQNPEWNPNGYMVFGQKESIRFGSIDSLGFPTGSQAHTMTFEFWVQLNYAGTAIFSGIQNPNAQRCYFATISGGWEFGWGDYSWESGYTGGTSSSDAASVVTDTWTHYCLSITSGVAKLYINGAFTIEKTDTAVDFAADDFPIGSFGTYNASFSQPNSIAEFRIYNIGLSATEISKNFNATRAKYGV